MDYVANWKFGTYVATYVSENLAARLGIYRGFDQIPPHPYYGQTVTVLAKASPWIYKGV